MGHDGRDAGADEGSNEKTEEIFLGEPFLRQDVLHPVADKEIKGGFADGKQGIHEIIDFRGALENEVGNHRDAAHEEEIQADKIEEQGIRHRLHQFSPNGKHQQESDVNVKEIVRRRHVG